MKTKFSLLQRMLLIALTSLLLTSVWSYSAFQNIERENERIVQEAIPIANEATELFRLLLDQELSVRGYTYNQDTISLIQYDQTKRELKETIAVIQRLDQQHPIMRELIQQQALPLIRQMEAFYESQIELVDAGGIRQANERRYSGIEYINQFRTVDAEIRQDIDKIIQEASDRSDRASSSARWVILIVGGVATLLLAAFIQTFRLERSKQALIYRSLHDSLTGIWNRRAFDEALDRRFDEAMESEQAMTVMLLDIDAFKQYNDTYGHLSGDACLERVAKAMERTVGETGLVARYGGEEFVVLLQGDASKRRVELAESIRLAVLQLAIPHESYHPLRLVTVSIGVATCVPNVAGDKLRLIEQADEALYEAKRNGRNRIETGRAVS